MSLTLLPPTAPEYNFGHDDAESLPQVPQPMREQPKIVPGNFDYVQDEHYKRMLVKK